MSFRCVVSSVDETRAFEDVRGITCQTLSGELEILPGHAEAFFFLPGGPLVIDFGGDHRESLNLPSAVCHVMDDHVDVIVEYRAMQDVRESIQGEKTAILSTDESNSAL